jgi:hypothetical protein
MPESSKPCFSLIFSQQKFVDSAFPFSLICATCSANLILLDLASNANHKAPPHAVFLSLTASSYAQMHFLSLYSRTPSVYILPLMWEGKFHAHLKTVQILLVYILIFVILNSKLEY